MSLDLVGACDVAADMVRLETLATDNGTLVDEHRVAETNLVRDRRANISQLSGKKGTPSDSVVSSSIQRRGNLAYL